MTQTRVFLVDDHPIVRYGFAQMLAGAPDLEVCGLAADAASALEQIEAAAPNVAVIDVSLGNSSGIDLVKDLKERWPSLAVLVLSMHDEQLYAERALRAGAAGYVMKQEASESIIKAIRTVAAGGVFVSEAVSTRLVQRAAAGTVPPGGSPLEALSDRELQVLQMIGNGLGTREIAEQLAISIKTVESYRARLKEKMNLRSGTELMRFAVAWSAGDHRK